MPDVLALCDLLVTDPPYGIKDKSKRGSRKTRSTFGLNSGNAQHRDWDEIEGDQEPFDPVHLTRFDKAVIFGANHFSSRLPDSRCWLIWDKREGGLSDDGADCELAWTNLPQPVRLRSQLWRGLCRRGEENAQSLQHPHQKPVELMQWVINQCKPSGHELLLDPYMGSGTTLVAAKRFKLSAIGIEIDERYAEIAAKRLSQEVFQF